MFLTPRFFIVLAALALCSAFGLVWPLCYEVARIGVAVLAVATVTDVLLVPWLSRKVNAWRECKARFSNAEPNQLAIHVANSARWRVGLTVRDELPREFRFHDAVFRLRVGAASEQTVTYSLTPVERGSYGFGHVLVFVRSFVSLVERKRKLGSPQDVKVYPAFERLERYELAAATDNLLQAGQKRVRRAGNSTEFEQIKDYVNGDDYRTLNWKASARSGRWMVNVYRDERSQPVWCLIDKGRVMQRTFADVSLLDYAINASLVLSYVALRRSDMAGIVTFGAHIDQSVPALNRPRQLQLILETLYAQQVSYAETDYSALSVHLMHQVKRRSLLVLFTDFTSRQMLERQLPYLRRMARRHALLVVFFEDPEVQALADAEPVTLSDMRMNVLASDFCQERRLIASLLRQNGIHPLCTTPQRLSIDVINRYLELKRRQVI